MFSIAPDGVGTIGPVVAQRNGGSVMAEYALDRRTNDSAFWVSARNFQLAAARPVDFPGMTLPQFPQLAGHVLDADLAGAGSGAQASLAGTAHARDLHGERIVGACGRRHEVEPFGQRGLHGGKAQRAPAQPLEFRQRVEQQEPADGGRLDDLAGVFVADLDLLHHQPHPLHERVAELKRIRAERFELMAHLAELPRDMIFFTQITMESAEDPQFLEAMRKARIKGALVGVEAVTPEGLKAVHKDFNCAGEELVKRLQKFSDHGIHILGSFIFGLPTDRENTFEATFDLARRAGLTFAQFVMLTPFPGTVDFNTWEKAQGEDVATVDGVPLTRYWLIPADKRPKMFMPHPTMNSEELRRRTQAVWDDFYSLPAIWQRSNCTPNLKARLAFMFISKLYRQMYASTGIATDSARRSKATNWARMLAKPCRKLFQAKPMPELKVPKRDWPEALSLQFLGPEKAGDSNLNVLS